MEDPSVDIRNLCEVNVNCCRYSTWDGVLGGALKMASLPSEIRYHPPSNTHRAYHYDMSSCRWSRVRESNQ
eukprot:3078642-Amphidinium_carterae.1